MSLHIAPETLKQQLLHPIRGRKAERLVALDGVSFDVRAGEFIGINGTGTGRARASMLKSPGRASTPTDIREPSAG